MSTEDPAVTVWTAAQRHAQAAAWDQAHRGCICKRTVGATPCVNPYQRPAANSDARKRQTERAAKS